MRSVASLPGVLCALLLAASAGGVRADGIDKQDFRQIERGRYLSIVGDCASVNTTAAATTRSPWMMTAPSCSGDFG